MTDLFANLAIFQIVHKFMDHNIMYYRTYINLLCAMNGRYVAYGSWGISKSSDGKNAQ